MRYHIHGTSLQNDREVDLFVDEDRRFTLSQAEDADTLADHGFLLPGLVDAHAHLAMASPAGDDANEDERTRASARAQLSAGVLAVREPGAPGHASAGLGPPEFPRVISAGRWLAPKGRFLPGYARETEDDELADAALDELRSSDGWVKVVGDWRPEGDEQMSASYRPESIVEAVRRVHDAGGRVSLHATIEPVIEAGIEAGADSLEHALYLEPAHIAGLASRGIALVPTMTAFAETALESLSSRPADVRERFLAALERQPDRVREASEAGVVVLTGTDVAVPHGKVWHEVEKLVAARMPMERVLAGASWEARRFLGLTCIEEGAPADLVVFDRDPREDVSALAAPSLVVLDGRPIRRADDR